MSEAPTSVHRPRWFIPPLFATAAVLAIWGLGYWFLLRPRDVASMPFVAKLCMVAMVANTLFWPWFVAFKYRRHSTGMSPPWNETRESLKWHQVVGLVLLIPVLILAVWVLVDPNAARGWFAVVMGLLLTITAYDWYGRSALGRARVWLTCLAIALAAFQLFLGVGYLTGTTP